MLDMEEHQFGSDESGDGPRPVLPELSPAQAGLVSAFARLLAETPTEATDGQAAEAAVDAVSVEAALTGAAHGWLARFHTSGVWAADGTRSPATWLSLNAEVSRERAAGRVRDAKVLRELPVVAAVAAEGRVGPEKTRLLIAARTGLAETFAALRPGWSAPWWTQRHQLTRRSAQPGAVELGDQAVGGLRADPVEHQLQDRVADLQRALQHQFGVIGDH